MGPRTDHLALDLPRRPPQILVKPCEPENKERRDSDVEIITLEYENAEEVHESLLPVELDVDLARSRFWMKYEEIASDYDKQFVDRLENEVDISMLFAGLFSAVNTAFIIAFQSNVVIVNSSNATIANIVNGGGLVSLVAWTTVLSYASLSASLLAAFGSLLAKQWLAHFKATRSTPASLSSRGIHRQRKLNAIQNSYFSIILDYIPLLLQASLLLFAISLLGITWYPYRDVAGVILAATGIGFTLYVVTFFTAVFSPDSPYQTLPSRLVQRVLGNTSGVLTHILCSHGRQLARLPRDLRDSNTKLISLRISTPSPEAPAVHWLSRITTDPAAIVAVAEMVPEVDWPLDIDITDFIPPLLETFRSCFKVQNKDDGIISLSCSNVDQAYTCSKALCHLYSEVLFGQCEPGEKFRAELISVAWCLSSTKDLSGPQEHDFAFMCTLISMITTRGPTSTTSISVPESELSERQRWLELAASISPNSAQLKSMSSKALADLWVIIALGINIPIHPEDLAKVNKSSAISRLRKEVCSVFEADSPYLVAAVQTQNTSIIPSAFDLVLRVLSVEQDRGMISERYIHDWIPGLYKSSNGGVQKNGYTIMEVMLETLDYTPSPKGSFQGSGKYTVHHVLEDAVRSNNVEEVGRVLSLWLNDPQERVDFNLCTDAVTLLLGDDSPRFCLIALHSFTQVLGLARSCVHSVNCLEGDEGELKRFFDTFLECDEGKLRRFFDTLLDPLHVDEDRVNVALSYLRVISKMADVTRFHDCLLARGDMQRCIDIRLGVPALAAARAETLQRDHSFLSLCIVASIRTCSGGCSHAAARPDTIVVENNPLEWQTIISALQYVQHALRSQLDANRIIRIAEYIELISQAPQAIPMALRESIAARVRRSHPSTLDSALVRLVRVLDKLPVPSALDSTLVRLVRVLDKLPVPSE